MIERRLVCESCLRAWTSFVKVIRVETCPFCGSHDTRAADS